MSYTRFAIYYMPEGDLAEFGGRWLGWDALTGQPVAQPEGAAEPTETPRKYGFHGTLKPPFRLIGTPAELDAAVAALAARTAPAEAEGLALTRLGRFLALTPVGDTRGIARVAGACVTELDSFRAAAPEAELARRRAAGLSVRQDELLLQWGYPYVLEEFRFHLTLTGRLEDSAPVEELVRQHLPPLPTPFRLDQIALVGERQDGRFELIHRYALTG